MRGAGTTRINAGAVMNISGGSGLTLTDARRLENDGTLNIADATPLILGKDSTLINNNLIAIEGANNNGGIDGYNASNLLATTIVNNGTVRKSGTGSRVFRSASFTNSGVIEVQAGKLEAGGAGTSAGAFSVAPGATLSLMSDGGKKLMLASGSRVEGAGDVVFAQQSVVDVAGAYTITGATTLNILSAVSFNSTTAPLALPRLTSAGTLNFVKDASVGDLTLTHGSIIEGAGTLNVTGTLDFTGGVCTMRGTGTTRTAPNSMVNINPSASPRLQDSRRFEHAGTMTLAGQQQLQRLRQLYVRQHRHSRDDGHGGFDGAGSSSSQATRFTNKGTLRKTNTGTTPFRFNTFSNEGTIEVQAGTLRFNGGDYAQSGGALVLRGGEIEHDKTFDLTSGKLIGTGTVKGNVVNSALVSPGVGAASAGVITITGTYTQTASGRLDIELGGNTPGTEFDQLILGTDSLSHVAALGGTLDVRTVNNFRPAANSTFQLLRYSTHTGTFARVNGLSFNGVSFFVLDYRQMETVITSGTGGAGRAWGDVRGPKYVRNAPKVRYRVVYGNSGGTPIIVPILIELPAGLDFQLGGIEHNPLVPIEDPEAAMRSTRCRKFSSKRLTAGRS
jgi:hypothetical protein